MRALWRSSSLLSLISVVIHRCVVCRVPSIAAAEDHFGRSAAPVHQSCPALGEALPWLALTKSFGVQGGRRIHFELVGLLHIRALPDILRVHRTWSQDLWIF